MLVTIDERTFQELRQQWPFPRSLHGRAIERLHAAGAKEIVYDVQFTEPSEDPDEDLALYDAVDRAGGAVLATGETDGRGGTDVLGGDDNLAAIHAEAGHSELTNDGDGLVTKLPRTVAGLESLALVTAERVTGRALSPAAFQDGQAWIDYRGGPGTFRSVPFSQVVRGQFDASLIRDKVVVVGATAPTLQDVHRTPTGGAELSSGAEVQANAIWTALHGLPLRSAPAPVDLLLVVLLALAAPLARLRLGVLSATLIALAAAAAYALAGWLAFGSGVILAMAAPLVALALGTVGMIVGSHLTESRERRRVLMDKDMLEERVRERTAELRESQIELLQRLATAVESRDHETGLHIERISHFSHELALSAGLSAEEAEVIRHASALHDVGKIGIPDDILLKPAKLTAEEFDVVKQHTTIGGRILAGSRSPLVQVAEVIALTHHERWDGSGYPAGLSGEDIPLVGRICAICDVFDALTSERPYKEAWSLEDALAEIRDQAGRQFDPRLVALFLAFAPRLYEATRTFSSVLERSTLAAAPAPALDAASR